MTAGSASDRHDAARVDLLGRRPSWESGCLLSVRLDDQVVADVAAPPVEMSPQHDASLVPDTVVDRLRAGDAHRTSCSADPPGRRPAAQPGPAPAAS